MDSLDVGRAIGLLCEVMQEKQICMELCKDCPLNNSDEELVEHAKILFEQELISG